MCLLARLLEVIGDCPDALGHLLEVLQRALDDLQATEGAVDVGDLTQVTAFDDALLEAIVGVER
eukprot:9478611-Pyramimonas_sp.AAC.1